MYRRIVLNCVNHQITQCYILIGDFGINRQQEINIHINIIVLSEIVIELNE